jgi:hypothetical protein
LGIKAAEGQLHHEGAPPQFATGTHVAAQALNPPLELPRRASKLRLDL